MHPLRVFRESHDPPLSQDDLAGMIGVTKATISRWEAGERFPDRDLWTRIKERTGLGPDELAAWRKGAAGASSEAA